MECSVVVPVYNSQDTLPELISSVEQSLRGTTVSFEIVLINDGSRDTSWEVIRQLARKNENVRGINLMRNYGQHNALLAGIRAARYDTIVTIDDDLQHPPDQIPLLLNKLSEGYDVVYGTPQVRHHGFWRDISTRFSRAIFKSVLGNASASNGSAFRAFRTRLRDAFNNYASPYVLIDVLLTWGTTSFVAIPVRHDPRRYGKSNYNFLKLVILALDATTGFSTWPLRLASLVGFGVTLLGLALLLFVIADYLVDRANLSIFRFFAALIAIFSGAQLFALGIIGEYIARMHFRVMARPPYSVREEINLPKEKDS